MKKVKLVLLKESVFGGGEESKFLSDTLQKILPEFYVLVVLASIEKNVEVYEI